MKWKKSGKNWRKDGKKTEKNHKTGERGMTIYSFDSLLVHYAWHALKFPV